MCNCRAVTVELERFRGNACYWSTVMDRTCCKERQGGWHYCFHLSYGVLVGNKLSMNLQCTLAAIKINCMLDHTNSSATRRLSAVVIHFHSTAVRLPLQSRPTRRKILKR